MGTIRVQDVEFGPRTALVDHALMVDREEIRRLILEDRHFSDVEVHLAKPGDSVRILNSLDVVEPRWKVDGPGGVFPGFVSPPLTVGDGRTNRLDGVAVVETGPRIPGEPIFFRSQVIDMSGPGTEYCPFGRTLNLVLDFKPNSEFFPPGSEVCTDVRFGSDTALDYNRALRLAGLRVAAHLGKTSQEVSPDDVETFELAPCDPSLPRVVCLYHYPSALSRASLYGSVIPMPLGTLMHPNEFYDGAVVGWTGGSTYSEQNNEVLLGLSRRHGKDLNFLGCIMFGDITPFRLQKERVSSAASKFAHIMGAQAAIVLGMSGSQHSVDVMLTVQKCELLGIKTTMINADNGSGPDDTGFTFSLPEAVAIVCNGSREQRVTLPPVRNLIGGERLLGTGNGENLLGIETLDHTGEMTIPVKFFPGATSTQGNGRLTTRFE